MLDGNIGKAVIKISAVAEDRHKITAPAAVFHDEEAVKKAYKDGMLNRDVIVVVRCQGPQATGMPELHSLTPLLTNLQNQGFTVGLVTDGRMSGASGKIPAAIHVCPEAVQHGPIAKVKDGDMVTIDAITGQLSVDADLSQREPHLESNFPNASGFARPLFSNLRQRAKTAEEGGGISLLEHLSLTGLTTKSVMEMGPVMPVVIEDATQAVPLADALLAGGIKVAEITLRSDAALKP